MVQVLQRPQSQGERFMESFNQSAPKFGEAFATAMKPGKEKAENEQLKKLTGMDFTGVSPELKKVLLQQTLKNKETSQFNMTAASSALDKMENLIEQSGIGLLGSINPSDEARRNRGNFHSLQASIVPIFKQLFPRGLTQGEFQRIMDEWVPQPGESEETIRGKIKGLREMLKTGKLPDQKQEPGETPNKKETENRPGMVKMSKGGDEKWVPKDRVKAEMEHGAKVIK